MNDMNRLVLTSVAFAILQVVGPRSAVQADVRPGQAARLTPRLEVPWTPTLERIGERAGATRLRQATPATPAAPGGVHTIATFSELPSPEPGYSAPVLLPSLLPDARAPPIQS